MPAPREAPVTSTVTFDFGRRTAAIGYVLAASDVVATPLAAFQVPRIGRHEVPDVETPRVPLVARLKIS
jgi:hypothetical protein